MYSSRKKKTPWKINTLFMIPNFINACSRFLELFFHSVPTTISYHLYEHFDLYLKNEKAEQKHFFLYFKDFLNQIKTHKNNSRVATGESAETTYDKISTINVPFPRRTSRRASRRRCPSVSPRRTNCRRFRWWSSPSPLRPLPLRLPSNWPWHRPRLASPVCIDWRENLTHSNTSGPWSSGSTARNWTVSGRTICCRTARTPADRIC